MKVPEDRACELAHVSRDTLRRYERGQWISTRSKRERLSTMYGMWRAQLLWSHDAGRHAVIADELSPRDHEGDPGDVYADESLVQTLPPPPPFSGIDDLDELDEPVPETQPSTRAA